MVIILGDAPPHAAALPEALKLAQEAHEMPFQRRPWGGMGPSPFFISCVAAPFKGGLISGRTSDTFRQIAAVGGGTYSLLESAADSIQQLLREAALGKKLGGGGGGQEPCPLCDL